MSEHDKGKGDQSQDKENVDRRKPGEQGKEDPSRKPGQDQRQTDEGEREAGKAPGQQRPGSSG